MPIRKYHFRDRKPPNGYSRIYEFFARALDDDASVYQPLSSVVQNSKDAPAVARLQLAQSLLQQKQFAQANQIFKTMDDKSGSYFHTNLGISKIGLGDIDSAIESLRTAIEADPDSPSAWYNLGVAYSRKNDTENAITSLKTAVRLRPNYAKARIKLGSLYASKSQLDSARDQFNTAVAIDAKNLEGYRKLAAIQKRLGNLASANAILQDGLSIDNNNVPLTESWIVNLLDPKNESTADDKAQLLPLTNRLVELKDSETTSLLLKSLALLQNRQSEECLEVLKKILPTGQRKPEAGIILAIAQKQIGSNESAIENYRNASAAMSKQTSDKLSELIKSIAKVEFPIE